MLYIGFSGISDEFYAPSVDDIDNKLSSRYANVIYIQYPDFIYFICP